MIERIVFTAVLAAQLLAIGAVKNVSVQMPPASSADMRADDPFPCTAPPPTSLAELRMDDPFPCTAPPPTAMA
jgi:hypothetical protein